MISLYFHIPFCTRKCPYCHFYVTPDKPSLHALLLEGLKLEWQKRLFLVESKKIASIYFGGGTPSLFAPEGIAHVMEWVCASKAQLAADCEITLEANPEKGDVAFFEKLREIGVNRLSFGVQSLDDQLLATLERTHSAIQAKQAIQSAQRAGFSNITIDLMYDLPDQTEASWERTLSEIQELNIQHLSLYNLTIEPHTSFHKRKKTLNLPSPEKSLFFLERAITVLERIDLKRYEISAFSKPGFASKHNLGYWTGRPFLGFGPSAFSYWEGARFSNVSHLNRYVESLKANHFPVDFYEKLTENASLREQLAVQLRLLEGVNKKDFSQLKESLDTLETEGWLETRGEKIRLTEKGLLFYDTVAAAIV